MLAADTAPSSLAGLEVVDRRGERLGRVRQVYRDGAELGWVGVRGNLFGTEEVLVPLEDAVLEDDVIAVTAMRNRFQAAPRRRPDAPLEDDERERLRTFWSQAAAEEQPTLEQPTPVERTATEAVTPAAEEEAGVMTASAERLHIETERVPRTRVRLKKIVVTEQRTVSVPVRHEEYRLIREPITDADPVEGGVIAPDEQEVVLYEERVVVTTEVVPVERIRLVKEEVVETREVSGAVRHERIELDDERAEVELAPVEAEPLDEDDVPEAVDVEEAEYADIVPEAAGELEAPRTEPEPQIPEARAMSTKRSTSSRSPRRPGSTPARSRTSAAADAPPSTGASD